MCEQASSKYTARVRTCHTQRQHLRSNICNRVSGSKGTSSSIAERPTQLASQLLATRTGQAKRWGSPLTREGHECISHMQSQIDTGYPKVFDWQVHPQDNCRSPETKANQYRQCNQTVTRQTSKEVHHADSSLEAPTRTLTANVGETDVIPSVIIRATDASTVLAWTG